MVLVVIKAKDEVLDALERARIEDDLDEQSDWEELAEYLSALEGDWVAVVRGPPYGDENIRHAPIRYLSLEDLAATSGHGLRMMN